MAVPPGPVADPLTISCTSPGAIASNSTAASRPVPDAPATSGPRMIVMSMRPRPTCWENVTFAPPALRKLPAGTVLTRSFAGSNTIVNVTVESRWAPVTEIGMLYGPCPTRSGVAGGEMITCAWPMPGELMGGLAACDGAPAAADGGGAWALG